MARNFGTSASLTTSLGALGLVNGPMTIAYIHKRANDTDNTVMGVRVGTGSTTATRYGFGMGSPATRLGMRAGNSIASSTSLTATVADGWVLLAATKAAGTVVPRYHKYVFSTGVWSHENAAVTLADSTAAITTGAVWGDAKGDCDVTGIWNRVLSDAEIELLANSLVDWIASGPKGLWRFDQETIAQRVVDLTGGGANQSGTASTTASDAAPSFSYGYPAMAVELVAAVTIAPAGIASAEAFGTTAVTTGTVDIAPAGIASGEAFGTVAVTLPGSVAAVGIASAEAFGTATVGIVTAVAPAGISSQEAFGSPTVILAVPATIAPAGIASGEAFGTTAVTRAVIPQGPPVGSGAETLQSVGLIPGRRAKPGYFRIKLTGLHLVGSDAVTLTRLDDFVDAEVTIPANDSRTARVTISMHDPACDHVLPYRTMIHVVYVTPTTAHLVFWGTITQPDWNSEGETVTLNAVDASLRMQHHYVRLGDQALATSNTWGRGFLPLNHQGLLLLRDAAEVPGRPPLGVRDGTFLDATLASSTSSKIKPDPGRGAEVWATWLDVVSHDTAPDFELKPVDTVSGVYCDVNTFVRQGNADPLGLLLHDGFGLDNCRISYQPGGKLITHAHVLSVGDIKRVTALDDAAADEFGVYVHWDATSYAASDTAALLARGKQLVGSYGYPVDYFTVQINQDADLHYLDAFGVGDACRVAIRRGRLTRNLEGQVTKVTLGQVDTAGNVVPAIEVVAAGGIGVEGVDS